MKCRETSFLSSLTEKILAGCSELLCTQMYHDLVITALQEFIENITMCYKRVFTSLYNLVGRWGKFRLREFLYLYYTLLELSPVRDKNNWYSYIKRGLQNRNYNILMRIKIVLSRSVLLLVCESEWGQTDHAFLPSPWSVQSLSTKTEMYVLTFCNLSVRNLIFVSAQDCLG